MVSLGKEIEEVSSSELVMDEEKDEGIESVKPSQLTKAKLVKIDININRPCFILFMVTRFAQKIKLATGNHG